MKTKIKYFIVLLTLFVLINFTNNSISYGNGGYPPPIIIIGNVTVNGNPITLDCGLTSNLSINSLIEIDILPQLYNEDGPTLINYSFSPAAPPGSFIFSPSLPVLLYTFSPNTIHFSWMSSLTYDGSLTITATDPVGQIAVCEVLFDWVLPVELSSFVSIVHNNNVKLNWTTSTEINNSQFCIERSEVRTGVSDNWNSIGTVQGNGNTNTPIDYSYTDKNLTSGKYKYRLKQIDFNGNYEYHNLADEVVIGVPETYTISQNFPNPFNPETKIEYSIPNTQYTILRVYNSLGKEVATLVNEIKPAGRYEVTFDGNNLGSGVYYYRITAGKFNAVKKMLLIK